MFVWSNNILKQVWLDDIKEIKFYPENKDNCGVNIPQLYIIYESNKHENTTISFYDEEEMDNFAKMLIMDHSEFKK